MPNKYIGEGSYGCVIKPGIKCKKYISNNTVSKFFNNKKTWLYEIKSYNIIKNILNKPYLINLIDYCPVNKNLKILNKNCTLFKQNKKKYNIIYEYDGIDLYKIVKKNSLNFKNIFFKFKNIFETINLLNKKHFIHFDLRLPNILYNNKKKILKVIDYGLMFNAKNKKILEKVKKIKSHHIYYLPFEFNKNNQIKLYDRIKYLIRDNNSYYYNNDIKINHLNKILKLLFDNTKINIKSKINVYKIDIYMSGIVLLEALVYSYISSNYILNKKEFDIIFSFIKKLINPNVTKRPLIKKVLNEYNNILYLIKKNTP
jgi:serine/threonine protein kinase